MNKEIKEDNELHAKLLDIRAKQLDKIGKVVKLKSFASLGLGMVSNLAGLYALNENVLNHSDAFTTLGVGLLGMGLASLYHGVKGINKATRIEINRDEVLSKINSYRNPESSSFKIKFN